MDRINLYISLINMFATVTMALVAFVTLRKGVKDNEKETVRHRKQITLEAYNDLQNNVFDYLNIYVPSEIRKICEDNKSEEYRILWGYVARIERFCLGLNSGIYDMDVFYSVAHGYFDNPKGLLMPRIIPILEKKLENAKEDYYHNIHKVWEIMGVNQT